MRGEDDAIADADLPAAGSPPHARGRPGQSRSLRDDSRITPACAGKTAKATRVLCREADHPRMRGEDVRHANRRFTPSGSPPHARGRLPQLKTGEYGLWITPACAGKTAIESSLAPMNPDHPRMRGEDASDLLV